MIHRAFQGWVDGIPPVDWKRLLAFDVGGSSANVLELAAQDPISHSIIFYWELHKVTTNMRLIAELTKPHLKAPGAMDEFDFLAKVGDYENKIALADMATHGIVFTNAVKQNKLTSVHRLASYLHPNPYRRFPAWHPRAGQLGAPLLYILPACTHLIEEIPQQKWKADKANGGSDLKDEMDRSVKHDAVDCALYVVRLLPSPADIAIEKAKKPGPELSLQSKLYWADVQRKKEETKTPAMQPRKKYNQSHMGGHTWKSAMGLS